MQRAPARLVARYRIALQREDEGFLASVVEMPSVRTRAARADEAVNVVRATAAVVVAPLYAEGRAPTPLCESEGPLGAWAQGIELVDAEVATAVDGVVEKPSPEMLRSIAEGTADDYRMIIEENEDGFVGVAAEMPEVVVRGRTAAETVLNLRRGMAEAVYKLLEGNRMPPEALRDVEARRGVRPQPRVVAKAA